MDQDAIDCFHMLTTLRLRDDGESQIKKSTWTNVALCVKTLIPRNLRRSLALVLSSMNAAQNFPQDDCVLPG